MLEHFVQCKGFLRRKKRFATEYIHYIISIGYFSVVAPSLSCLTLKIFKQGITVTLT